MREKRSAEKEAELLRDKLVVKKQPLGIKDLKKITYFLKNIHKHHCFKEVLSSACLSLLSRQTKLSQAENKILSLLKKNWETLGIPKVEESFAEFEQ